MKTNPATLSFAKAAALVALAVTQAAAQGSLAPPGAPAPTMKTLEQIEPRTPISALPYVIDTPGSYYLTGTLHATSNGITIAAQHVTLDLMGFTLFGSVITNATGIHIAGGNEVMLRSIVVRNGGVTQFGTGIRIDNAIGGLLQGLAIHQNTEGGIRIQSNSPGVCSDFTVEGCVIADNNGPGIYVFTLDAGNNRTHTFRNNKISGNLEYGINMIRGYGCLVEGNHFGPQIYVAGNAFAVRSGVGRNLIVRNYEYGNSANPFSVGYFSISGSDTLGPIVNKSGGLASTNHEAHAWGNFSR